MSGEMKYCRNCGQQISRNAKFCKYCGMRFQVMKEESTPTIRYCRNCGEGNSIGASFCRNCGKMLGQPVSGQPAQTPPPVNPGQGQPWTNTNPKAQPSKGSKKGMGKLGICLIIVATLFVAVMAVKSYLSVFHNGEPTVTYKMQGQGQTKIPAKKENDKEYDESDKDIWKLTDEQKQEYALLAELPDMEPVEGDVFPFAEPMSAHDYDWKFVGEENQDETETEQKMPAEELPQMNPSPAFSVSPIKGITISADEGALDHERTFTITEVSDEEYRSLNDGLEKIDNMSAVIGAWELDAGLKDDEVLPGGFTMEFDLSELEIDEDLYDSLCVYRVDDSGNWYPYAVQQDGKNLKITSSQNSLILIGCLVTLPLLPDIFTTMMGVNSGAVYDPRAKSFYVEVDGKRTFQILATRNDVFDQMEKVSEKQFEEARINARREAKKQYKEYLGYSDEEEKWLEYTGKDYYRIYIKCLKAELAKNPITMEYQKQLINLQNNSDALLQVLKPVIMVIDYSREAYRYLRDHTGAKMPDHIVRIELSDDDVKAYGVTVPSYTFTRNPYMVLFLKKYADGSKLDQEKLLLTLVHELFHVIQRGYKSPYTADYKFDEVSAQVVEWEAYDWFYEQGKIVNDLDSCLDNLEHLECFAIPLDKFSVKAYPEGELKLDESKKSFTDYVKKLNPFNKEADVAYPIAPFLRYMIEQHITQKDKYWGRILTRYGNLNGKWSFTSILKSCFLVSDNMLTKDYQDYASHDQVKFFKYVKGHPEINEGFKPITMLKPGAKTGVELVNRDYVIRARQLRFMPTSEFTDTAIVLKKHSGFDDVMSDFRIIPAGLEKDKDWREWASGIFLDIKTIKKNTRTPLICVLLEADGGTAEKTEGWFSDTPAGYDLYLMTAPDAPKSSVAGTTVKVEPMKLRTKDLEEVVDGVVFTLKLDKTIVHEEQVLYKGWDKPWSIDLSGLRIGGKPITEEQIGQLKLSVRESVTGTYGVSGQDPCLGPAVEVPLTNIFFDELAISETRLRITVEGISVTKKEESKIGKTKILEEDTVSRKVYATIRKGADFTFRTESLEHGEMVALCEFFDSAGQPKGKHMIMNESGVIKCGNVDIPGLDRMEEKKAENGKDNYIEWTIKPPDGTEKIILVMTVTRGEGGRSREVMEITVVP